MNTSVLDLDHVSRTLFEHILRELTIPLEDTRLVRELGLPDATIDVLSANLMLSVTCIEVPFFQKQMLRVVEKTRRDLIVARTGFHPETLNDLLFDCALNTVGGPLPLFDLSLYRSFDRKLHLVPSSGGPCVSFTPGRVRIASSLPFSSREERRHGREKAAAEFVRRLR